MPDRRATRYTPAVTIVAAWISAETGVGPAIASGSQTCSGICADLPVAPMKRRRPTRLAETAGGVAAMNAALIWSMSQRAERGYSRNMPSRKPASPMRLMMNAFLPARGLRRILEPEADQQVRREPDAFPADEQHQQQRPSTSISMKKRNRFR